MDKIVSTTSFDAKYMIISSCYRMGAIPAVNIILVNVEIRIAQL